MPYDYPFVDGTEENNVVGNIYWGKKRRKNTSIEKYILPTSLGSEKYPVFLDSYQCVIFLTVYISNDSKKIKNKKCEFNL